MMHLICLGHPIHRSLCAVRCVMYGFHWVDHGIPGCSLRRLVLEQPVIVVIIIVVVVVVVVDDASPKPAESKTG